MGPGDMDFRDPRMNAADSNAPVKRDPSPRRLMLAALTLLLAAGALLLGAATGAAKDKQPTTRTVSGTVYDDAQNIIVGASIELKDTQTGKVLGIYSQESGEYQYNGLRFDHDYTIKAMYKGSSSDMRRISMFDTRWHLVMNLTIPKPTK